MSHTNMTDWIEDADGREIRRDAAFLAGAEHTHYLDLGAVITKLAEWWHHHVHR
jgi:hypothetical protein